MFTVHSWQFLYVGKIGWNKYVMFSEMGRDPIELEVQYVGLPVFLMLWTNLNKASQI